MKIDKTPDQPTSRILRLPEVKKRTGLSRSGIYQRMKTGTFPKRVSLGARCVGWIEADIERWIGECAHVSK